MILGGGKHEECVYIYIHGIYTFHLCRKRRRKRIEHSQL